MNALRKPFRRKSAPTSPVAPPRTKGRRHSVTRGEGNDPVSMRTNKPLVDEEWFHGVLSREEVVRLLTQDGDFLIRETTSGDGIQSSLMHQTIFDHHRIMNALCKPFQRKSAHQAI